MCPLESLRGVIQVLAAQRRTRFTATSQRGTLDRPNVTFFGPRSCLVTIPKSEPWGPMITSTAQNRQRRSGLTMVELLLVITVVGIVTAIGLPNVNTTIRQRRVIAASSALASDVEAAYTLAARQRRPVRLTYQSSTGEVRVADRASGTVYRRRALRMSSEYHLDGVTMLPPVVDVFPTGLSSAAFSVRLTNGSFQRQIVVGRTGLTRVIVP